MNDSKNGNILFVVNSLSGGGAENSIGQVADKLFQDYAGVHLCALNGQDVIQNEYEGSHTHVLNRNWKDGIFQTYRNFRDFRKVVSILKPRIVIANCELPELFVAIGSPFGSQIIAVEHTSNPWSGRKFLGVIVRFILKMRKVHWVTVLSSREKIWNGSSFPGHIANPITAEGKPPATISRSRDVVFIGRLRKEKRPDWAIESALEAGLSIELFGDGTQRAILESNYRHQLSSVTFHGYVENPWCQVSNNSIVVVPSEYEGDGMVVAEAIIRNHKILLADNSDLRRFNLPEENYFKSQEELTPKLVLWDRDGRTDFSIPAEIVQSMRTTRDIATIVEDWRSLLHIQKEMTSGDEHR
jgi:glycosyltransferase involved in cell wall biosynthesis